MIRRAQRSKAKLRLGISAPSGAGKTYSSLLVAFGLGGKIGMIDTEHGSGDLYSHLGEYDIINLSAPFTVRKYLDALREFEGAGYSTVIIDSLSHAWAGDGGLLDKQGRLSDSGRANSFTAWRQITPEHNSLVEAILASKCHIIATMRSKQEYVLDQNDRGRQTPRKLGLAPIQREGMEYEFTVFWDLDAQHNAQATKDRTSLFDGTIFRPSKETGESLLQYLNEGVEATQAPSVGGQDVGSGSSSGIPGMSQMGEIIARVSTAQTLEELDSIVALIKELPEEDRAPLRPIFAARRAEFSVGA